MVSKISTSKRPVVLSYGGGAQTCAMCVLVDKGLLPKPDRIVCADTGREVQATWDYMNTYMQPMLAKHGLKIEVIPHAEPYISVDLKDRQGKGLLLPMFTRGKGRLRTFVRRYLRETGVAECIMWFGMSIDEVERLKVSDVQWIENHYPLCGMPVSGDYGFRMNRADCIQLILNAGYPHPPKSACFMCPERDNPGWQDMKVNAPADFAKAVQFEQEYHHENGGVWLHEDRKPLDEIDFTKHDQPRLLGCEHGWCML